MTTSKDHLSKAEIRKDAVQDVVEAAAGTVGQVATIVTGAVRDLAGVLGGLATEVFEIRDAARRAAGDQVPDDPSPAGRGSADQGSAEAHPEVAHPE